MIEWLNALYVGFLNFIDDTSIEIRLVLNTLAILITLHLLFKRIREVGRKDYITPFRVIFLVLHTVILVFSIPLEAQLISLYMGYENTDLQNLARIAGGVVIFAFVVTLEIVDIVIGRINTRAKKLDKGGK